MRVVKIEPGTQIQKPQVELDQLQVDQLQLEPPLQRGSQRPKASKRCDRYAAVTKMPVMIARLRASWSTVLRMR